ncbi:conserved hypothetical protein [Perkinsus marinus ATCC 50983]|uniref:At4g15545-like C-terminal domain-containing protein n=1 Tax=Perkinsus marinus (strain ATCC 50983 / TXsc) TaxID=423536 RepID=C5KSG2_PERM5|nr:conserved hypothetical protein [Perkinsus marinus ATCC 50983]EER12576.1 conserved hypothetical protein [Perkinsus marinus ATCC 50983]|eukprot:XP_002780781.1 conserved hypothetical protein [Perkinsus marinus ATCC 50983]
MTSDDTFKRNIQLSDSPDECLGVGIKIIQNAFISKMQSLEHEVRVLRLSLDQEKAAHMQTIKKANALNVEHIDSRERCQKLQEENRNLIQNLRVSNQQLEHLKRLKQTLVGGLESFQSESHRMHDGDSIAPMAASPAPTPMCTTSAMPDVSGDSGAGGPPSKIDAKRFFKMARSRLSHESFGKLLVSIKRLHAEEQSADATLADVEKIFADDGKRSDDLCSDLAALLHRRD